MSDVASPARTYVGGLGVANLGTNQALTALLTDATKRAPRVYVLVNAHSATLRRRDETYARLLSDDSVVPLADGASLTLGARLVGQTKIARCPGPDLFETCARVDGEHRHFLLGGDPGVVEKLEESLKESCPAFQVVGAATPPYGDWSDSECRQLVSRIRRSNADVVWLGVSAPKQETWAVKWREEVGRPIVCVGAAFDFLSGVKRRAPSWMRRAGLEWVHRLLSEPRRLWRRYLVGNTVFLFDVLRYRGTGS